MPMPPRVLPALLRLRPYEVELLRPRRHAPPLSWLLLGLGVVALLGAAWVCAPGLKREHALAQQRAQIESKLAVLDGGPAAGSGFRRASGGKDGRIEEAQAIVRELNRPWPELFAQLEAANTNDVNVMQMSVEPRFTTLQLVAESRDLGQLVRFSQRLSSPGSAAANAAHPGPIRAMTMTHHEWRDALGARVASATMQGELADGSSRGAP